MLRLILVEGIMNFGEKLKAYRRQYNLTQKELGSKLKTSQSTIHLYEKGKRKPSTKTVARVARMMNLNPYELAQMVKEIEFAKEPSFHYGSSDFEEIERAFELMIKHLSQSEISFIVQIIYELIRNKNENIDENIDENIEEMKNH